VEINDGYIEELIIQLGKQHWWCAYLVEHKLDKFGGHEEVTTISFDLTYLDINYFKMKSPVEGAILTAINEHLAAPDMTLMK
jgi:hypothetical protein